MRLFICNLFICFFFFFQAEDGIRDTSVTGVQTCALPICPAEKWKTRQPPARASIFPPDLLSPIANSTRRPKNPRSEERRVGKECSSRWAPDHLQKKHKSTELDHQHEIHKIWNTRKHVD